MKTKAPVFLRYWLVFCLFLILIFNSYASETITNLAVGSVTSSASIHNESYTAPCATDGSMSTRWNSLGSASENEWLKIELLGKSEISKIDLYWYAASNYANRLEVAVSDDDVTYTVVNTRSGIAYASNQSIVFETPISARYVKLIFNECASKWGYSLKEVEIYGTSAYINLALNKTVYGSSNYTQNGKHDIAFDYLVDGSTATRWSSLTYPQFAAGTPVEEWVFVDLGKICDLSYVKILWHNSVTYAKEMTLQVSDNGIDFKDVKNISVSSYSAAQSVLLPRNVSGRYIKLAMHVPSNIYGYSITEFEVYGTATEEEGIALPNTEAEYAKISGEFALQNDSEASGGMYVSSFDGFDTMKLDCYDLANNITVKYRAEQGGELKIYINGQNAASAKYPSFTDTDSWGEISVDAYIPCDSEVVFTVSSELSLDSVKWNDEAQNELSDNLFLAKEGTISGGGQIQRVIGAIRGEAVKMYSGASLTFLGIPSGYKSVKLRYSADENTHIKFSSNGQNKEFYLPATNGIEEVNLSFNEELDSYITALANGDITVDYIEFVDRIGSETVVVSDNYTNELHTTVSLDGNWQCMAGEYEDEKAPLFFDNVIPVPGMWDMAQDDLGDDNGKCLWYQKTVVFDSKPENYTVNLLINKAYYGKTVYVNGELIGSDPYNFTVYSFDITDALVEGKNTIQIKVGTYKSGVADINNPAHMGYDLEKSSYLPGIVDSVSLEIHKTPYITQVQTSPNLDNGTLQVAAVLKNDTSTDITGDIVFKIYELGIYTNGVPEKEELVYTQTLSAQTVSANGSLTVEQTLEIPNFDKAQKAWTPSNPYLYRLEIETVGDKQTHRFGMRTFTFDADGKTALLNGEVYYLRGTNICINRFYEDESRADHPWDEEWVRTLFTEFKSVNFESARFCVGFPPSFWYDICDEIGFLVADEYPFWRCETASPCDGCNADDLEVEVVRWIYERNNHPCVVWWDIQNESPSVSDREMTATVISNVRDIDLQKRPWDNGWGAVMDPTYPAEQHLYSFKDTGFTLDDIGTDALKLYYRVSAIPNVEQYPNYINEFGWLWVDREGNPTSLTKAGYATGNRGSSPEEYKEFYAIATAQLAERYRSLRLYFGIMQFCGLSYSHSNGKGATSDILAPDLTTPMIRSEQKLYLRSAFAPVGIVIDDWSTRAFANSSRTVPVSLVNDLSQEVTKDITVTLYKNHKEADWVELSSQTKKITAAPFEVTNPLDFEVSLLDAGAYTIVASYQDEGEAPIESRRYIEVEELELFSEGKAVTATAENADYPVEYINDGDPATRWHSGHSLEEHTQSVTIDLGELCPIDEIYLYWENAYATHYKIQIATEENGKYTDIYEATPDKNEKITVGMFQGEKDEVYGRYVRLLCLTPYSAKNMYSVWEFQVYKSTAHDGDIDRDGEVTIRDVLLALKQAVNKKYSVYADVVADGNVSLLDAIKIFKQTVD